MSTLQRIAVLAGAYTRRTFLFPMNILWMLVIPIVFSLVIGAVFSSPQSGPSPAFETEQAHAYVVVESPRGREGDAEFARVRSVFGVYIVFALSALMTRGAALHIERDEGTLERVVASGVPYHEVVAAHLTSIFLVGGIQSLVFFGVTGLLGTEWFANGGLAVIPAVIATLFVGSGIAIAATGLIRSAVAIQWLSGGIPGILAMAGGAFFPLEAAPSTLQQLARINPIYWSMEALLGGFIFDGLRSQIVPLSVLLLVGILGIIIGIQGLRRMEL